MMFRHRWRLAVISGMVTNGLCHLTLGPMPSGMPWVVVCLLLVLPMVLAFLGSYLFMPSTLRTTKGPCV